MSSEILICLVKAADELWSSAVGSLTVREVKCCIHGFKGDGMNWGVERRSKAKVVILKSNNNLQRGEYARMR